MHVLVSLTDYSVSLNDLKAISRLCDVNLAECSNEIEIHERFFKEKVE